MRYIVTNFAYGYGPFIRTTELALALNTEMVALGKEPYRILVPWVYGEKQKRIMLEEFVAHADTIVLDETLGAILKNVFYADTTYEEALRAFVQDYERVSLLAHTYLLGNIHAQTLSGLPVELCGGDVQLELARAPRISYNVAPVYGATFGHISEILEETLHTSEEIISADRTLVAAALPIAKKLERAQQLVGLATPGTFSYKTTRIPQQNEIAIPPTITTPTPYGGPVLTDGIYVTITGIPGLERLYAEARALGLMLYTNDPERLPGSTQLSPHAVGCENISLHFARSGWGSVWESMLQGKAIVVPEFDPTDDPEIYFNNACIEKLGIGVVYRGEPLSELLQKVKELEGGIQERNANLLKEFGTSDGNEYFAKKIAAVL